MTSFRIREGEKTSFRINMGGGNSITFFRRPEPEVSLVGLSDSRIVALATRGYSGKFGVAISPEEVDEFWRELELTKLKTPLEMVHATFLFGNVTRSFTHQLARYRLGTSLVQESMRFSVQSDARILIPARIMASEDTELEEFMDATEASMRGYWAAIHAGIPTQDARAMLPHAITTRVFVQFSMLTLANVYRQRACCQAQEGEWEIVVSEMKNLIEEHDPKLASVLRAPWEDPSCISCGFGASFDRPCTNQAKFDANLRALLAQRAMEREI